MLPNPPATFDRLMDTVLSEPHWEICLIHIGVIDIGNTFGEIITNLSRMFDDLSICCRIDIKS